MDYTFAGLPLHVLLVHALLVLTPLVTLALVLIAAWSAARRILWIPVVAAAALLLPLGLVTIEAGKWLEQRVPQAPLIQAHTAQGEDIVPWLNGIVALAVVIAVWAVVELMARRRTGPAVARPGRAVRLVVGVVLTLAALAIAAGTTWTLVRIGEAGSRAVWEGSFSDEPLER